MGKSEIAAVSATYTIANKKVASALGKKARHSGRPSLDLDEIVADIPEAMKEKALEWYLRGIKRGMKKATDLMLEGKVYMQDGAVYAPDTIRVKVRTRFRNEEWSSREFQVKAADIGFDE
ncbi:hypothetical protein M2354_004618 [Leclercia adecarboxylata]|uniref:hypothetical protein n=1 Tax=Leclercia adecarboxylata TaxID=83655 RepID=UPI002476401F|nr:hypothetical protein [Leclercia adecarboxylata]MDH6164856.1 hypothetical protein [Leclercia adecarboxylata]